jgi:large-conductance mechanosensitive channel
MNGSHIKLLQTQVNFLMFTFILCFLLVCIYGPLNNTINSSHKMASNDRSINE